MSWNPVLLSPIFFPCCHSSTKMALCFVLVKNAFDLEIKPFVKALKALDYVLMNRRLRYVKLLRRLADGAFIFNYIMRESDCPLFNICLCHTKKPPSYQTI